MNVKRILMFIGLTVWWIVALTCVCILVLAVKSSCDRQVQRWNENNDLKILQLRQEKVELGIAELQFEMKELTSELEKSK